MPFLIFQCLPEHRRNREGKFEVGTGYQMSYEELFERLNRKDFFKVYP